jgi:hypothetical protein
LWLTKLIVGESDSYDNVIGVHVMEKPTG